MSKEIYISSTPHETRLAIVENDELTEIYYERENEYTLAGSIYNGKVTRVLPGMQSSFVDVGLERDAFLYITDFMEEAGDSADFDAADGQRNSRSEGRRGDRSTSREQGERPALAPSEAASEEAPLRSPEREGGRERNGRGGRNRRGGRDRDRNIPAAPMDQPTVDADHPSFAKPPIDFSQPQTLPGSEAGNTELGEGAPGADGSRRWRGRRGRRGRRGPDQTNDTNNVTAPTGQAADISIDEMEPFSLDAASEVPAAVPPPTPHPLRAPSDSPREDRDTRGRRDRNDRNDRGRAARDRDSRGPRAPRGFAPRTSLYGVENTPAYGESTDNLAPPAEPILLPGEVLSKYRKPAPGETVAETASSAPSQLVPQPGFILPAAWDGGNILPGESLSRMSRQPPPQEQRPTSPRNQQPAEVAPVHHHEATRPSSVHEDVSASGEYEPTEATTSYRVDPAAPSEFRQSAPVAELHDTPEEPKLSRASIAHTITPAPAQPVAELHASDIEPHAVEQSTPEVPVHDVTLITTEGEMHSTAPAPEPSAVIANKTSIVAYEIPETPSPQQFTPSADSVQHEEQAAIEEEEYSATLHASSIEEMDDFDEEETLEGAADLGTMLREMSIDQITRPNGAQERDDLDDTNEHNSMEEEELEEFEEEEGSSDDLDETDTEEDVLHEESAPEYELPHELGAGKNSTSSDANVTRDSQSNPQRDSDRPRHRRDGRRDGRRDDRSRSAGGAGDRERSGGRSGRHSMQSINLPAISDLLKPGQEVLVQIAKEPIAKKGARITSHIALPGRFLVFMPTVNHTGVSRKIESDTERRRLKEILLSEKGEASGGFIVRTAASGASEEELRSDLRFLLNLWADIKQRSESSKSPALIYHDLNLVERILRDQVTDNFSAIWVDTEGDYERILRFLQRFQPSLIRRVKLYSKETPLFEQFGITEEINKALRSKVWLKSGGSIVINQTEALVAIDINTGKYVGKTARLEDTIVKTNLDAIPEIVRQIRLRDLGGIIIIDFIDMDERKNRNRVMAALEEELRKDRAPSKILQFNDFGLVAITRKRVKQSLERTLSTTCGVCQGTGMVKSPVTVCNDIFIEMRKMHKHLDRGDVMLRVHPEVVKQLKSSTKWLQEMEEMAGKTILIKSDPSLHPEQFDIH